MFELPQIEPLITEYVRLRGVCSGCGLKHHGALPVGVPTGQLGARALALVGTLAGQFVAPEIFKKRRLSSPARTAAPMRLPLAVG